MVIKSRVYKVQILSSLLLYKMHKKTKNIDNLGTFDFAKMKNNIRIFYIEFLPSKKDVLNTIKLIANYVFLIPFFTITSNGLLCCIFCGSNNFSLFDILLGPSENPYFTTALEFEFLSHSHHTHTNTHTHTHSLSLYPRFFGVGFQSLPGV